MEAIGHYHFTTRSNNKKRGLDKPTGDLPASLEEASTATFTLVGKYMTASITKGCFQIRMHLVEGKCLFGPAWSLDGTRIAFSMSIFVQASPEIFTILADDMDRHNETTTADNEVGIDWWVGGG